jgi:hypothetical protein
MFPQMSHEGLSPPRLLTLVNYDTGTFDMAILQPKAYKTKGDIKAN